MAESMNRTVEYACKGTSFLGLQNYGRALSAGQKLSRGLKARLGK